MSPTQRSLAYLRKIGYRAAVVEKWNPHVGIRQDLFGFADIFAFAPVHPLESSKLYPVVLVQTTTQAHAADRLAKIAENESACAWVRAFGTIEVHGWAKRGPRGKRKTWSVVVYRGHEGSGEYEPIRWRKYDPNEAA